MASSSASSSTPPQAVAVVAQPPPAALNAGDNSAPPSLVSGVTVIFHSDEKEHSLQIISYNGVQFHVAGTRLQGRLQDAVTHADGIVYMPEFEYASIIPDDSDGVDEKEFRYLPSDGDDGDDDGDDGETQRNVDRCSFQ